MKFFCEKNLKNVVKELGYTNVTFDSRVEDVRSLVLIEAGNDFIQNVLKKTVDLRKSDKDLQTSPDASYLKYAMSRLIRISLQH